MRRHCRGNRFDVGGKWAKQLALSLQRMGGNRENVKLFWSGEGVQGCMSLRRDCEVRTWKCVQSGAVKVRTERYCESAYRVVLWKCVQSGNVKVRTERYCESAYRAVLWKCVQSGNVKVRTERYCESAYRTVLWKCVQSGTVQMPVLQSGSSYWCSQSPAELCRGTTSHRHPTEPAGQFWNWVSVCTSAFGSVNTAHCLHSQQPILTNYWTFSWQPYKEFQLTGKHRSQLYCRWYRDPYCLYLKEPHQPEDAHTKDCRKVRKRPNWYTNTPIGIYLIQSTS